MWENFTNKVSLLRLLDRRFQIFGSDSHCYRRHPVVTSAVIANVERDNEIALPEQLRNYYLEFGDGVAGCSFGISRLALLRGFRPLETYATVAQLTDNADVDEDGYFEIDQSKLSGLLVLEEQGCGHLACVISSGPRANEVVYVSNDGFVVESGVTMLEYCENVYDERLAVFRSLSDMMTTKMTLEEIEAAMTARFNPPGAATYVSFSTPDYISSIADVEKPASLFGTRSHLFYGGKGQRTWYRRVLAEWRNILR